MSDRIPFLSGGDAALDRWFDVPDANGWDTRLARALAGVTPSAPLRVGPQVVRGHAAPATVVPGFRSGLMLRFARVEGLDATQRAAEAYARVQDGAHGLVWRLRKDEVLDPSMLDEAAAFDPRATAWVIEVDGDDVDVASAVQAVRAVGERRYGTASSPRSVRWDAWAKPLAGGQGLAADATGAWLASIAGGDVRAWTADARTVDGLGAGTVTRLAFVFASLSATAGALAARGWAAGEAAGIEVVWPVGLTTLEEVAALRALRVGVAALLAAWSADTVPVWVSATTSTTWLTDEDAANNTLRETLAVSAAMLGGADAIEVAAPGAGFEGSRRLAVTGPAVLALEARLDALGDVGAGAATVEGRTASLLAEAWALAASWDAVGGLEQPAGLAGVLDAARADRLATEHAVRTRRQPIIGVSQSPAPVQPAAGAAAGWRKAEVWAAMRRRFAAAGVAVRLRRVGTPPPWRGLAADAFGSLGADGVARCVTVVLVGEDATDDAIVQAVHEARSAGAEAVIVAGRAHAFGADAVWCPGDDAIAAAQSALDAVGGAA